MILLNDFFFILQQETTSNSIQAKITINSEHKILKGHFPGMPVVPGVCMVNLILEIMERLMAKPVHLSEASSIKFLAMMVPADYKAIEVVIDHTIQQEKISIKASIFSGTTTFFKLNGTLIVG